MVGQTRSVKLAVRIGLVVVVIGLALFVARLRSTYRLLEDVEAMRAELRDVALAPSRGVDSVPSEAEVRERATSIAAARGFEPSAIEVELERNVAPTGTGGRLAETLGTIPGTQDVDAEGNLRAAPPLALRVTRLTARMHVHGDGFLCSVDDDLRAIRQYGYGIR